MKFETTFTVEIPVTVKSNGGKLMAWVNTSIKDEFDYEPYEEMLADGASFEEVCEELANELREEYDCCDFDADDDDED